MRTHGRAATYNDGCRCDACRQVGRVRRAEQRRLARRRPIPPDAHGKLTTYTNRGCRCALCRAARHDDYETNGR